MLIYTLRQPYCDYLARLCFLNILSLYMIRLYIDVRLLYVILHAPTYLQISDLIFFGNNGRPNRINIISNSPRSHRNYGYFVNIFLWLQRSYQAHIINITIFDDNHNHLKKAGRVVLNRIQISKIYNKQAVYIYYYWYQSEIREYYQFL